MNVADLVDILKRYDPCAVVVLWDQEARPGPGVTRLREADIQPLRLTGWESNGVLVLELDDDSQEGSPMPAIVLGSK